MTIRSWMLRQLGGVAAEEHTAAVQAAEARGGFEVYGEAYKANLESYEASGQVTNESAMQMSAVYACIRILAETVGSLPLKIFERQARGRREAPEFYLYGLLHDMPNPQMTAMEFREVTQAHLVSWGNAYSRRKIDGRGRVVELWPLHPAGILQDAYRDGRRFYQYQDPRSGKTQWYSADEIWHLRGLGDDGRWGYNPIALMRKGIKLGMAAETFGQKFFQNDARPGVIIEHPARLKDEAYERMKKSWAENHQGPKNYWKPDILEEGAKLHEVGIPPEDAQFLETRKFQIIEIARIFRVPPHMLAELDRATWANIEQQSIEFIIHSIRPWLVRWEQSIRMELMTEAERARYYPEHVIEGLLRGDIQSRYAAYAVGRQNGWLSANDIRELENMNPIDGGDVYLVPLNMVPADKIEDQKPENDPNPTNKADPESDPHPEDSPEPTPAARGLNLDPVLKDALGRIYRRELNDVRKKAEKLLKNGDLDEFRAFLHEFYEQHAGFCAAQLGPVLNAAGLESGTEMGEKVAQNGLEAVMDQLLDAETRSFGEILSDVDYFLHDIDARIAAEAREIIEGIIPGGRNA
jgi:HK97 family phage portal protein